MLLTSLLLPLLALPHSILAQDSQIPLQDAIAPAAGISKRVAIIGAGPAGSATAWRLRQLATAHGISLNLTVYERNATVGGRSTTVHAYDDALQPALEVGASIFVAANEILVNATRQFGLGTSGFRARGRGGGAADLGIWDGQRMVLVVQTEGGWWDVAKLVWRYGVAPWKTVRLMRRVVAKFMRLYDDVFPFEDLKWALHDIGLRDAAATSGRGYMDRWEIKGPFGREVVQASTRVNYGIGLADVSGVVAMVCMATEGAMSVEGGNWQIFEAMVQRSGAVRAFGTEVVGVKKLEDKTLEVTGRAVGGGRADEITEVFDDVVLAAPYQFANVLFEGTRHVPAKVEYVKLHVTLLTSKHLLDPEAFGYEKGQKVPTAVLTTTPDEAGVEDPGFNSISLLTEVINPNTKAMEFAYKIFTMEPVNSTFLGHIFGLGELSPDAAIGKEDISWIYRKLWSSYPYEYPREAFEPIKLASRVWYTGGMESFISTMETNSLMGMNIAQLMADTWIQGSEDDDEEGWEYRDVPVDLEDEDVHDDEYMYDD